MPIAIEDFALTATSWTEGAAGIVGGVVLVMPETSWLTSVMIPTTSGGTGGVAGGFTGGGVTGGVVTGGVFTGGVVGVLGVLGVLGVEGVLGVDGVDGVDGIEPVVPVFLAGAPVAARPGRLPRAPGTVPAAA